ncbi:MAG TPA: amidohydrolase [Chitinophagaceae bacterium]|jgi:hypothetical protein|nr:amidohydrolase [Chitinophagaceae bacterium]
MIRSLTWLLHRLPFLALPALLLTACKGKQEVDLLIFNATLYTVDSAFSKGEALVVRSGRIEAVGTEKELRSRYEPKETIDAGGKFLYPGLIDAHAHFYSYGLGLQTADLVGTRSWSDILQRLLDFARNHPEGWLVGRGWDQNDWEEKSFPDRRSLDSLFPGRPVLLSRIDGHASIANEAALKTAGVQPGQQITGGSFETVNGRLTGILIDNAATLLESKVPPPSADQVRAALQAAQRNCFAVGLTTVADCGLEYPAVETIDSLQRTGQVQMRIYAMLSDARQNYEYLFRKGIIKTDRMHVRSFKVYADGALGSRGACLLQPYSDRPGWSGFLLQPPAHFDSVARILYDKPFQMCTHAIGDSGNRVVLQTYGRYLKGKNDRRWRIEHAQVVAPEDFALFGRYSVVPSVQPTHATSDMYWAGERLGKDREKGAYAYRELLEQNGWIPLGTDFPVEDISPFKTFFAAVARQDALSWPQGGYQPQNALSRQHALRGMTIWAARSLFEEGEKGSLEKGKWADFILLDRDLMTAPLSSILETKVLATFIGGKKVFAQN